MVNISIKCTSCICYAFIFVCILDGNAESLGEADPQFSSSSRRIRFENKGDSHNDNIKQTVAQDRMESEETPGIDPALLQAVLADPVLLQAVDPRVLQAVLVSAAAANLALPDISTAPPPAPSPSPAAAKLPTPVPVFPARPELQSQGTPQFGSPFNNLPQQTPNNFPEQPQNTIPQQNQNNFQQQSQTHFGNSFNDLPQERAKQNNNNVPPRGQQKFGGAFQAIPSAPQQNQDNFRQPQQPLFRGNFNQPEQNNNNQLDQEVEFIVEDFGGKTVEKLRFQQQNEIPSRPAKTQEQFSLPQQDVQIMIPNLSPPNEFEQQVVPDQSRQPNSPPSFNPQDLLKTLQDNPDIAREFARQMQADPGIAQALGLTLDKLQLPSQPSARQILPPAAPPGVCSLVTANGIPCDPGLAFDPLTGSCEWPDKLIEAGCNPEVVTGFGPCPQDAGDPHLNPAQIESWPYPKFPVNLDVVTVHNFDAVLAKKYFIVCVPTIYEKLFPRLICCPHHEYFDPFHVDGCVYEHYHHLPPPPPLPHTLPPPNFGTFGGFSALTKRSSSERQPAIEFLTDEVAQPESDVIWPEN